MDIIGITKDEYEYILYGLLELYEYLHSLDFKSRFEVLTLYEKLKSKMIEEV